MKAVSSGVRVDMISGSIWNKIILFALPIAASSILQQLFNAADVAIAGRFAGPEALAAVGSTSALVNLIINLFVGCATGVNVVVARYAAQKNEEKCQEAVSTAMLFALLSGIFLVFVGFLFPRPILCLMGSPEDVIELSVQYLEIYFIGMPFLMLYNFGASVLRSVGDTRRPLIVLTIAGVVNVIFNLFFVIVCGLGVVGVAIATIISEMISCTIIIFLLVREKGLIHLDLKALRIRKDPLKKVVSIGLPAGIQGIVFSLSNVCIQSAVNSLGSVAMAGSATSSTFESFSFFFASAFAQTAVTFVSQNYAAGSELRCKRVYHDALVFGILSMLIFDFSVFVLRYPLLSLFTTDPEVMRYAVIKFECGLLPHSIICLYEVTAGALRAMGKSMLPAIICIFGTCVVRLLWLVTVFRAFPSFRIIMVVYPVSWVITATFMLCAYNIEKRKLFALIKKNPAIT